MNGEAQPVARRDRGPGLPRERASPSRSADAATGGRELSVQVQGNTPYDGRFVFVRLEYSAAFGRYGNWIGDGGVPWSHDYPDGEVHFLKILDELTLLHIRTDGSNILGARRPGAVQLSGRLHGGAGLLGRDTDRGGRVPQLPAQGRLRRSSTTSAAATGTTCRTRCAGAAGGALDPARRHGASLPLVLRDPTPGDAGAAVDLRRPVRSELLGPVRGQRSDEAADGDRQREQRHQRVPGSFPTPASRRSISSNEAYKFGVNYVMYGLTH